MNEVGLEKIGDAEKQAELREQNSEAICQVSGLQQMLVECA